IKELVEKGPGDARHVHITGGVQPDTFLTMMKVSNKTGERRYIAGYVPLLRPGDSPDSFRVLVLCGLDDNGQLKKVNEGEGYRGYLKEGIGSLSSEGQEKLKQQYPKVDFSKVWLLDEGSAPLSNAAVMLMFFSGIIGP